MKSPPLKYHGGKNYLASWIQSLAPRHTHRVICCAGGLGEFWTWPHEGVSEVVNDIDGDLVNFYRVLQHPEMFEEFARAAALTPFSREAWEQAKADPAHDLPPPVASALNLFVLIRQSRQGLKRDFATPSKRRTRRGMNEQVSAWLSAVEGLPEAHERLSRVYVECLPAAELIHVHDDDETFFYLDPPYLPETRASLNTYAHEMTFEQHVELLDTLAGIKGMFAISAYRSDLYDAYAEEFKWRVETREIDNKASAAKTKEKKVEALYMNYGEQQ